LSQQLGETLAQNWGEGKLRPTLIADLRDRSHWLSVLWQCSSNNTECTKKIDKNPQTLYRSWLSAKHKCL